MILTSTSFHKSDCCKTGNVKIIFPISEAAAFLDNEILNIQNSLPESIAAARASKAEATRQENVLGVSYGTAIVGANVAYTASQIWDKNLTEWQYPDWGTLMANTAYAWGYGALWLLDGQLDTPDPGCGLQTGLVPSIDLNPGIPTHLLRLAVKERDINVRTAISCLEGEGDVFSLLEKLLTASLLRLEITQTLSDISTPTAE